MTKVALYILILVGILEIYLGMLAGELRIYSMEIPFAHAIGLNSLTDEEQKAFWHYIREFKGAWVIVAWMGVITIALAYSVLRSLRGSGHQQRSNQADQPPHKLIP